MPNFKTVTRQPGFYGIVGRPWDKDKIDILEDPVVLIARFGRFKFIHLLLDDKRLSTQTIRRLALGPAIRAGRLDMVNFIPHPRWGRLDLSKNPLEVQDIIEGTLNSSRHNFYRPLVDNTRLYADLRYPGPDVNEILHDVALHSTQRVDVVERLIACGAVIQDKRLPKHRRMLEACKTSETKGDEREAGKPWNPLRRAVMGGNEKIVKLPLKKGADPNLTDYVFDQAVKRGSLNIVRMLV